MATENTLVDDVRQHAKALEDWAVTTLGNTTARSSEADQALRHHGTKGLRGRPFSYTVGAGPNMLILHAKIAGILLSTSGLLRTIILVPMNMQYREGTRMTNANLVFVENNHVNAVCWMLMRDVFNLERAADAHAFVTAILEIE